jgi:NAD(P)-dependent dehydrogenase (short-subunit alcohol dehydrogenase family)
MYNPFNLQEKTILVTGATSGIGKGVAIECSKMGATLVITGRNEQRLSETFEQLNKGDHKKIIADLRYDDQIGLLISLLSEIDGIVHCAGIVDPIPFQFVTRTKLNEIFEINFFSPSVLTQSILKKKLLRKNASIVFISSVSGVYCSSVAGAMYSSTKGAINGLIKGMALDLASKGIRVNSVCPAMIDTNIFNDGRVTKEQLAEDKSRYPLNRYGKPEEVAYAAIYLLSDASKWVTGTNLLIDGGYTLL